MTFNGKELSSINKTIKLSPNTSKVYYEVDTAFITNQTISELVWHIELKEGSEVLAQKDYYFQPEKNLHLEVPKLELTVRKSGEKYLIDIKTDKLAKAVFISLNGKEGMFSDNYFDLLPNQSRTIELVPANGVAIDIEDLSTMSLVDSYAH